MSTAASKDGDDDSRAVVLIGELIDLLALEQPVVREELVAAARARIADGDQPTAEVLAGRLIERLL
jgi:hypothetical protein